MIDKDSLVQNLQYDFKGECFLLIGFVHHTQQESFFYKNATSLLDKHDPYNMPSGERVDAKLLSAEKMKNREVLFSYFMKNYHVDDDHVIEVSPRINEGYAIWSSTLTSSCPVCGESLGNFDVFETISCPSCTARFMIDQGDEHPENPEIFKVCFTPHQSAYEFDHYSNGATRSRFLKLNKFNLDKSEETKRLWASLLYTEQRLRPELSQRLNLLERDGKANLLTMTGYIFELGAIVRLITRVITTFKFKWLPERDALVVHVIFAGNILRHTDEKDIELLDVAKDYTSMGGKNLVFNLVGWEYENFQAIKKEFGLSYAGNRKELIEKLYVQLNDKKYLVAINELYRRSIIEISRDLGVEKSLEEFPWLEQLIPLD